MSESNHPTEYQTESAKVRPLGIFLKQPHTPLLTSVTKAQSMKVQSPFFTSPCEDSSRTQLANPELFKFSKSRVPTLAYGTGHHLSSALSTVKSVRAVDVKMERNADPSSNGKLVAGDISRDQHMKEEKCQNSPLSQSPTSVAATTLSLAHHDPVTVYLDSLEQQVIPTELNKELHQPNYFTSPRKIHKSVSSECHHRGHHGMGTTHSESNKRGSVRTVRSHKDSLCSNGSGDESVTGQSRCSVCDCSSLLSTGRLHSAGCDSGFLEHIDTVIRDDAKPQNGLGFQEFITEEELTRCVFKDEDFDCSSCRCSLFAPQTQLSGQHSRNASGDSSVSKKVKPSVSLTKEQLVYLLQRVELSKYRMIMEERLSDHSRMSRSQQKTVACLIQAVIIINKRMQCETDRWTKIQMDIQQLQLERAVLCRRQTRLSFCACAVLCLYLLNITAVRNRLLAIVRYFGIVETVKKVNRTRKMIAENWRNIPSLLTNFWRIFIFRTSAQQIPAKG